MKIGNIYLGGLGVEKNVNMAYFWYGAAFELGNRYAICKIKSLSGYDEREDQYILRLRKVFEHKFKFSMPELSGDYIVKEMKSIFNYDIKLEALFDHCFNIVTSLDVIARMKVCIFVYKGYNMFEFKPRDFQYCDHCHYRIPKNWKYSVDWIGDNYYNGKLYLRINSNEYKHVGRCKNSYKIIDCNDGDIIRDKDLSKWTDKIVLLTCLGYIELSSRYEGDPIEYQRYMCNFRTERINELEKIFGNHEFDSEIRTNNIAGYLVICRITKKIIGVVWCAPPEKVRIFWQLRKKYPKFFSENVILPDSDILKKDTPWRPKEIIDIVDCYFKQEMLKKDKDCYQNKEMYSAKALSKRLRLAAERIWTIDSSFRSVSDVNLHFEYIRKIICGENIGFKDEEKFRYYIDMHKNCLKTFNYYACEIRDYGYNYWTSDSYHKYWKECEDYTYETLFEVNSGEYSDISIDKINLQAETRNFLTQNKINNFGKLLSTSRNVLYELISNSTSECLNADEQYSQENTWRKTEMLFEIEEGIQKYFNVFWE